MKLDLPADDDERKKYVFLVYILQALSFLLGVTAIVAVIVNYIKDDDMQGSWLETHFLWQKRTFWYGLLWMVLGTLTLGFLIGYLVLTATTFWLIYRIARGWIFLVDGKSMYA
jgi:uncharacterized membrane protein